MIKNLVFDFGGVVVKWDPRRVYNAYFGDAERADWFVRHVVTGEWNSQMDLGRPFSECVRELQAQYPEWSEAIALYHSRWNDMMGGEVEDMDALLGELDDRGVPLYGLTNWSMEMLPGVMARHALFRRFRGIVVSAEEGVAKPDARIYRILLDRYGLRADECLFIDDNADNVEGAQRVGLHGHRFTAAGTLRGELVRHGLLEPWASSG